MRWPGRCWPTKCSKRGDIDKIMGDVKQADSTADGRDVGGRRHRGQPGSPPRPPITRAGRAMARRPARVRRTPLSSPANAARASTTWESPSRTSTRPWRSTGTPWACRWCTVNGHRAGRRGRAPGRRGRPCRAAPATAPRHSRGQVPGPQRPRASSRGLPGGLGQGHPERPRRRRPAPDRRDPAHGIRGSQVAFVHPVSTGGVLTEIVEPAHNGH